MKKLTACEIFLLLTLISSCTNYRFINSASPANNPYFNRKGDSKVSAYFSSTAGARPATAYAYGFDLHSAYAIGNHWALTAGYFNRIEKDAYSANYNVF